MPRAPRHPERHPTRWLAAAAALAVAAGSVDARAQVPGCELFAETAELVEGETVLHGVRAECGEVELFAESARYGPEGLELRGSPARAEVGGHHLSGAIIWWREGALAASDACLGDAEGVGATCCGATVAQDGASWRFEDVTCAGPDGATLLADEARWDGAGIALTRVRSGDPLALPYPVARLDRRGRAPGLRASSLGYSTERGLGGRTSAFVPVGAGLDLDVGAFGESDGGAGLDLAARWPAHGRAPSTLGGFVAWDGTTDRAARGELRADLRLGADPELGLAAVGQLDTDSAMGRDYGRETAVRQRPDRHLAAAAWAGGTGDRLWLGVYERQVGRVAPAPPATPVPDHLGHTPTAGWLATLQLAGGGQLAGALRFDRASASGTDQDSNRLRLVTGGELFAASSRVLTVVPGLWLEADVDFSNPQERDGYRRFDTRLFGTLALSSPWVGGRRERYHLLEPRAQLWWRIADASDLDGEAAGLEPEPEDIPRLRTRIGLGQSVVSGAWTLSAPLDWLADVDDGLASSHVLLGLSLARAGGVVWRLDHRLALDTDDGTVAAVLAATSVHVGTEADGLEAGRRLWAAGVFGLGAAYVHVAPQRALSAELLLPNAPLLRRGLPTRAAEAADGAQLWTSVQLGPLGLAAAAVWPLVLDERPDLSGALWLGRPEALRFQVTGGYLADDTGLVQLTLVLGNQSGDGPWTP